MVSFSAFLGERKKGDREGRREGKRVNSRLNQLKEMVSGVCCSLTAPEAVGGKKSFLDVNIYQGGCLSHGATYLHHFITNHL